MGFCNRHARNSPKGSFMALGMTPHLMTGRPLTDAQLDLLRRAVGTGCLRDISTEGRSELAELISMKLIWKGWLTSAGWKHLWAADRDPWLG